MATSTESLQSASIASGASTLPGTSRAWHHILRPSLADCFFVALLAWLFVCGANGWKSLLMDGDTGYHIRTGEYILQHHAVPKTDLFSFSRAGAPWFAWEWLTDVLYAVLFRVAALKAIVFFAGILIAAYGTVILRYSLWRGANSFLAIGATLLAVGSASIHFLARPHLFTLFLLPICIWLVEADRRRQSFWLWVLIPLTALWTNLHGGVFLFLACLGLLVVGSAIEDWQSAERWAACRRYSVLWMACAAASLLNPYGIGLHQHVLEYLRADWIKNTILEFQAPTFRNEGQLQFEALLLAGLVLTGFLWKNKKITSGLWLVFLAHSSLISVRHATIYASIAAPLVAGELSAWWESWSARQSKSSIGRIIHDVGRDTGPAFRHNSAWPAVILLVLALMNSPIAWPQDFPSEMFPVKIVHQNAAWLRSERILTTDQWGDYLIYCFYPQQKVYVDGRSDFYGEKMVNEYLHLFQGSYEWQDIVKRHGFQAALLPVGGPLATLLKWDPSWQVIQDDGKAILFRRRPQQNREEH